MSTPTQTKSAATLPQRARWSQHVPVRKGRSGEIVTLWLSRLGVVSALSILAMAIAGCGMGARGNSSPSRTLSDGSFRWTLTRLEGATAETQIGWLDNETVLFIGSNDSADGSPEIRGLYAWNQKSPARLVLADAYRFCYDGKTWTVQTGEEQDGSNDLIYRRYRLNPSDLSTTWIGPDEAGRSDGFPNPYTCRHEKYPISLRDRHWTALRPQDGYLDFGADRRRNQQVELITSDPTKRIPLGFRIKDPSGRIVQFSEFLKSYIIYDAVFSMQTLSDWEKQGNLIIHLVDPKGYLRKFKIGAGPWSERSEGDRSIEPTSQGIAVSTKAGDEGLNSPIGLYLQKPDNSFTKLDNGIITELKTSPDGCNLTYIQNTRPLEVYLKTAHVCTSPSHSNKAKQ